MCFYHDYTWTADVVEDAIVPTGGKSRCEECGQTIHPWEPRRAIYQQQHEECCYGEECRGDECTGFGETFECDICLPCNSVRAAIRAVELRRGCRPSEAEPALTELARAMREADEDGDYADEALRSSPGIGRHLDVLAGPFDPFEEWSLADTDPVAEIGGEG